MKEVEIIDVERNPFFHESWRVQNYPLTKHRKEQLEKLFGQDEESIKKIDQNTGAYPAFVGIRWGFAEVTDKKKLRATDKWHNRNFHDEYGQKNFK